MAYDVVVDANVDYIVAQAKISDISALSNLVSIGAFAEEDYYKFLYKNELT
jgi:hypothetical protein